MLKWPKFYGHQSIEEGCGYRTVPNECASDIQDESSAPMSLSVDPAENYFLDWCLSVILGITFCALVLSLFVYLQEQYNLATDPACTTRMSAYSQFFRYISDHN